MDTLNLNMKCTPEGEIHLCTLSIYTIANA